MQRRKAGLARLQMKVRLVEETWQLYLSTRSILNPVSHEAKIKVLAAAAVLVGKGVSGSSYKLTCKKNCCWKIKFLATI